MCDPVCYISCYIICTNVFDSVPNCFFIWLLLSLWVNKNAQFMSKTTKRISRFWISHIWHRSFLPISHKLSVFHKTTCCVSPWYFWCSSSGPLGCPLVPSFYHLSQSQKCYGILMLCYFRVDIKCILPIRWSVDLTNGLF